MLCSLMVPEQVCYEAHQFLEYPIRQAQNKEQNFKLRFGHSFASDSPLASTAQTCSINFALTSLSFFFPATGVRIRWAQLCASSTASCAPSSHGHRHKSRRMSTFPFGGGMGGSKFSSSQLRAESWRGLKSECLTQ